MEARLKVEIQKQRRSKKKEEGILSYHHVHHYYANTKTFGLMHTSRRPSAFNTRKLSKILLLMMFFHLTKILDIEIDMHCCQSHA